jgi:hypothetical protein
MLLLFVCLGSARIIKALTDTRFCSLPPGGSALQSRSSENPIVPETMDSEVRTEPLGGTQNRRHRRVLKNG